MKKILIFFMFLLSLTSLAKRFIIISKDGYSNLRKEGSTKSRVLAKVDNSYTIVNLNQFNSKYHDWYLVAVEKQVDKDDYYSNLGYIHKSQLAIHPETYVISSKDDYVNVRSKPSTSSELLDELYVSKDYDTYVTRHPEKTVGDWYYVDYVNYYDDGEVRFDEKSSALAQGYIHKSQLKKFKK